MPYLRPMATISHDTLGSYGRDADGAGIHDVIGTRCDPYTNLMLAPRILRTYAWLLFLPSLNGSYRNDT
jgi:uncharacterized protein YcgI (DUF1989 family)